MTHTLYSKDSCQLAAAYRNSKGYEIAEQLNSKFTHISPVWLQLRWDTAAAEFAVAGQHDIDAGWMQRVSAPQAQVLSAASQPGPCLLACLCPHTACKKALVDVWMSKELFALSCMFFLIPTLSHAVAASNAQSAKWPFVGSHLKQPCIEHCSIVRGSRDLMCTVLQSPSRVKIVPRVLFELDQTGLLQLLTKPNNAQELLVQLCKQHKFDGLVWTVLCHALHAQNLASCNGKTGAKSVL